MYANKSVQQDRLAQLSDDNAFVDVEAALRRMGGDVSLEAPAQQRSTETSSSPYDAVGKKGGARGGGSPPAKRVYVCRGSRASKDALLNGARVPLTASLQEQHKAYLESVRAAAEEVEELSNSSDSGLDEDGGDEMAGGAAAGRRAGPKSSVYRQKSSRQQRGRAAGSVLESSSLSVASLVPVPGSAASPSVLAAKRAGAEGAAAARTRQHVKENTHFTSVKQEGVDVCSEATVPPTAGDPLSTSLCCDTDFEKGATTVPHALVAQLNAQLCLIEQWRRTVLDNPPQIINGVLSPQPYAPWAAISTTSTADAEAKSSSQRQTVHQSSNFLHRHGVEGGTHGAWETGESVLPYPLLQLYSLCPSYEALTAAPVGRRHIERVPCNDDDDGVEGKTVGAKFSAPLQVRKSSTRSAKRASLADHAALSTKTVEVAGVSFSIPITRRRRNTLEGRSGFVYRPAGFIDFKISDSTANTTVRAELTGGDGVQGVYQHHLCSVCMLPASYRCVRCRVALFCSIECHVMHDATRCLKFTV
ncbi:hypothetical protein ABL78_8165 [Leptomonas seymouri]|uniref:HIT-type domain-containing protein n=1 Tax=Leptomonas seymouri TaxID=5684 RepID=A0A0N1HYI9_LEPSE|nr:hypothetical protein ABL78_8165 [Leptomonas seymouri]|eukprot:KPI82821.1 hypothetical protein ABL78_8165 [Leptomonas seymouri]